MVEDVSQGISFVCNNVSSYGGDPERIYLVGQSAGAHIAACTLLNQAIKECGEGDTSTWSVAQLKAYFGISGGYNLLNLVDHFHRRGLYRSIFLSIMEGEESLRKFSPEVKVKDSAARSAISLLPHIILFHGTSDCSMPSTESQAFLDALQQHGAKADLFLYEGKTHTDLFLQVSEHHSLEVLSRAPAPPECMELWSPRPSMEHWSWESVPSPFDRDESITSYALHPDGHTIFMSVRDSLPPQHTFSFDTKHGEWRWHGEWVLPFQGRGYFDSELDAWVGLHKDGYICSCQVASLNGSSAMQKPE